MWVNGKILSMSVNGMIGATIIRSPQHQISVSSLCTQYRVLVLLIKHNS